MVSRICLLVCGVVEELSDIVHFTRRDGRACWDWGGYIDVAGEKIARMMGGLGEEKGKALLGPVLKGWCRTVL